MVAEEALPTVIIYNYRHINLSTTRREVAWRTRHEHEAVIAANVGISLLLLDNRRKPLFTSCRTAAIDELINFTR
jgi:hypothetical protein